MTHDDARAIYVLAMVLFFVCLFIFAVCADK